MDKEELEKEAIKNMEEFELAWQEFFKDKPAPKNDQEDKKQQEEFYQWYNYERKQMDTGKTPAQMYKEAYGQEPRNEFSNKPSRFMNFEWDEDYDEEMIHWIYDLQEYDNEEGYKLEYVQVKAKLEPAIKRLTEKGEKTLNWLKELLEKPETWSSLFALEILKNIKSEKSVSYLIDFIVNNQEGEYFESCDDAVNALVEIGPPAVGSLIFALKKELDNNFYGGYLDEALSHVKDARASEFRLSVLKDYIENPKKYNKWFNLELFTAGFREWDKDALEYLKKLRNLNLTEEEKAELESAIECIEDPIAYKKKQDAEFEKLKPILEKIFKPKIGRNEPCPCGSGKKYKKCCLNKEE